jgi:hypothetical protein
MQVTSCGSKVGMPQQMLNRAEIGAGFQHVGRAGVPEQMGMNALLKAGTLPGVSAEISNRPLVQQSIRPSLRGKQP